MLRKARYIRFVAALIISTLALSLVSSVPFFAFYVHAGIAYFVLRYLKLKDGWQYAAVMLCVSLLIFYSLLVFGGDEYRGLYNPSAQAGSDMELTKEDYLLALRFASFHSLIFSVAFYLFWFIAVRQSPQSQKSKKWYAGVTGVYLSLAALCTIFWVGVADLYKVPGLIVTYVFPYIYILKIFGSYRYEVYAILTILLAGIIQFGVLYSYLSAVRIHGRANTMANGIAIAAAIFWFVAVTFILFVAHLH